MLEETQERGLSSAQLRSATLKGQSRRGGVCGGVLLRGGKCKTSSMINEHEALHQGREVKTS